MSPEDEDAVVAHLPLVTEAFRPVLDAIRQENEDRLMLGDRRPIAVSLDIAQSYRDFWRDLFRPAPLVVAHASPRLRVELFTLDDGSTPVAGADFTVIPVTVRPKTWPKWKLRDATRRAPSWVAGGGNARQRRKRRRFWARAEALLVDAFRDGPEDEPMVWPRTRRW